MNPPFGSDSKMSKTFKSGDHAEWNLEADRVRGTVVKKVVTDVKSKRLHAQCHRKEPLYFIKSVRTGHVAIHKGQHLGFRETLKRQARVANNVTACVADAQ